MFYLFGGESSDTSGAVHALNDLWRFNPGTQTWTVVEPSSNPPPARSMAASSIDLNGNVWIFGGRSASGTKVQLYNDLWQYNPSTQRWDCESGCGATPDSNVTASLPAAREAATTWIDSAGELWVFGGTDSSTPQPSSFADLWRYSPSTFRWTQVRKPPGIKAR